MFLLDAVFLMLGVFVSVAFLTLVERKVMGGSQSRKGPNKVSIYGILQPISDALKLFSKSLTLMKFSKLYFFMGAPFFGLVLMMLLWVFYPSWFMNYSWDMEMMLFFALMGLLSYFLFFCGFSSSSVYSIVGYVRSVAQTISYEVCIIIFILWFVYMFSTLAFCYFRFLGVGFSGFFFFPSSLFLWMFLSLSESNRSPFDFSEGESEIVSGFNIEYFGGIFSMIFIFEYGMIIYMSFVGGLMFFGSVPLINSILFFSFLYIWSRSSLPRYRYDKLMEISWMSVTPTVVLVLLILMELNII